VEAVGAGGANAQDQVHLGVGRAAEADHAP
jgi:hypothetical protein